MKVFVAGGTGVIGRRAVRQLVERGHEVSALVRSEAKAELVRSLGATPVEASLFDADALREAVAGHEVVINLATHIPRSARRPAPRRGPRTIASAPRDPPTSSTRRWRRALAATSRSRSRSSTTTTATSGSTSRNPWPPSRSAMGCAPRRRRRNASPTTAATGWCCGSGSSTHPRPPTRSPRSKPRDEGGCSSPGAPGNYLPSIAADDAAAAVVVAVDAPPGVYNIVDSDPVTREEWGQIMAAAVGRRRLHPMPRLFSRMAARKAPNMVSSQRVSNRRFCEAAGWAPLHPSMREGVSLLTSGCARERRKMSHPGWLRRVPVAILAVSGLNLGVWIQAAPRSFFDEFPGFGHRWVSALGPYNEHLLRDFGGMNLALGLLALVATVWFGRTLVRAACGTWFVFAIQHVAFHVAHVEALDGVDRWASPGALVFVAVIAVLGWLLAPARPPVAESARA